MKIKAEQPQLILFAANLEGISMKNFLNMKALTLPSRGYDITLQRDIDEIMINNYNPEWIKAWNANMGIQIYL